MMSQAERDRLQCLKKASEKVITRAQAAGELEVSERQVYRLLKTMKKKGDEAAIHGLRGRSSNRKLSGELEEQTIGILKQEVYRDFGPTLASEYLAEKHKIEVSKETVRRWMVRAGLRQVREAQAKQVHVWRQRRERWGEMVQWDTSEHDWLEGRGEKLYLIAMIDDATSRVFARFVRHDSTEENMGVLKQYLERYGRPLEYYTDRASLFTVNRSLHHNKHLGDEPSPKTQIGRALEELGIGWIAARSPQAKGRVERSFETAQDRLVKGLRVAGVNTLEQANGYLEAEYLPQWKAKFGAVPRSADDAHRPLTQDHDLNAILCQVEERVVTNDYTIRFASGIHQIAREHIRPRLRGARVRVEQRQSGEIAVRWEGRYLPTSLCEPALKSIQPKPAKSVSGPGKAHNAGGKSQWMNDFFQASPAISIAKAIKISNATS